MDENSVHHRAQAAFLLCGVAVLALVGIGSVASAQPGSRRGGPESPDGVWHGRSVAELVQQRAAGSRPWVRPNQFRGVELRPAVLDSVLADAPFEDDPGAERVVLYLPHPDGGFESFAVAETAVMHPTLAAWMADQGWPMRTYVGKSLADPGRQVWIDSGGPAGFHAMVRGRGEGYFIDPYWQGDRKLYASYFKRGLDRGGKSFECDVHRPGRPVSAADSLPARAATLLAAGDLRTYRTAVAATKEYTAFHGGTKLLGQAAVVTTMNRVSGIYTQEASIAFQLVANNDLVIYASNPDPYNNNNGSVMLGQNQSTLDSVIGSANYDLGHVVSTGGGGVALLGVTCESGFKAQGVTGLPAPIGDPFDVDYVAHEIGHQANAEHTWNGALGSCSAGQHNAPTAMEVGSASTIMGYAGICGSDDIQSNSDANFHAVTLDEIITYSNGAGACGSTTAVNANAPTVSAPSNASIPISTPFELTAQNGNDTDGGPITYSWEQFDAGTRATVATGDDGVQPIFRAWPPTTNPTRTFPRLAELLANTTPLGETLPVTNRTMNFRVTVRDNFAGGGRLGAASLTLTSTTSSGPFLVTYPNGGEVLTPGNHTVTWDVAGTTGAPVSAASVDIFLSQDGGLTYPVTLAAATPNDGSEVVALPGLTSTPAARIKVKGSGNVFFDVSNSDFSVNAAIPAMSVEALVALAFMLALMGALLLRGGRKRVA